LVEIKSGFGWKDTAKQSPRVTMRGRSGTIQRV
jgi:hypothetical protein